MRKILLLTISLMMSGIAYPQDIKAYTNNPGGVHQPKYSLFYDNHTMPACPDVGETFDVEEYTDRIKACGVDYLTFHARCNLGMAYYDTKIGIKHPSLKYDLFKQIADACKRKEIALTAYLNGGISSAEGYEHRDWTTVYPDGRVYRDPRLTPWVRTMCPNTAYRDHLISMVQEIANNYPVSGFFIDCINGIPCVCPVCIGMMKDKGIDWTDETKVADFAAASSLRLAEDIAKAARDIDPNYMLYFNGITYADQARLGTHLECEHLPTAHGGYEVLPVLSAYMRTLGFPSFARAFVTEQAGRRMVHLLSYVPELRGSKTEMIEEPLELHNIKLALRHDGKKIKKVYQAPDQKSLPFKIVGDYIEVTIPVCDGYALVVFNEYVLKM